MSKMRTMWLLIPFALLSVAAGPSPDAGALGRLPLATVVEKMQRNYDQAKDFRARFSQRYTNVGFSRTQVSTGEVLFKKPGRMRWNYDKPVPKMFLSTGQLLWLYEPEDAQAFKQDLKSSQLPAALAFLMGKGKLTDEFDIVPAGGDIKYGSSNDHRLLLKPKQPQSSYKAIYFIVDAKSLLVIESVLIDPQGNVNDITFTDLKVNTKLPESAFVWSPPKGTRIIDAGGSSKETTN